MGNLGVTVCVSLSYALSMRILPTCIFTSDPVSFDDQCEEALLFVAAPCLILNK